MRCISCEADIMVEEFGIVELLLGDVDVDAAKARKAIRDSILNCSIEV